jgi:hypothetical protein
MQVILLTILMGRLKMILSTSARSRASRPTGALETLQRAEAATKTAGAAIEPPQGTLRTLPTDAGPYSIQNLIEGEVSPWT